MAVRLAANCYIPFNLLYSLKRSVRPRARRLRTLMARLKVRCLGGDCSASMRGKNADSCCFTRVEVRTVLRRWILDAVLVGDCSAEASTANTLDTPTPSGLASSWSSSSASGKPLDCYTPTSQSLETRQHGLEKKNLFVM